MSKKESLRNRRYYLSKRCKSWNKESGIELLEWLKELEEIAEELGEDLTDYITPEDVPSENFQPDVSLVGVWGADKTGLVVVQDDTGLNIIGVGALPKVSKLTLKRRNVMKQDQYGHRISTRIDDELKERLDDYCWNNRLKVAEFLRIAIKEKLEEVEDE